MIWLKATDKLREIREKTYTQDELVDLVNLEMGKTFNRTWYTRIEGGQKSVSSDVALVISKALDANLNELFKNGDTK